MRILQQGEPLDMYILGVELVLQRSPTSQSKKHMCLGGTHGYADLVHLSLFILPFEPAHSFHSLSSGVDR